MSEEEKQDERPGTHQFLVAHEQDGMRLDQCLVRHFSDLSRAFLQRCVREGRVTRNGRSTRQAARVGTNDLIRLEMPDEPPTQLEAEPVPFEVLAEDDHILRGSRGLDRRPADRERQFPEVEVAQVVVLVGDRAPLRIGAIFYDRADAIVVDAREVETHPQLQAAADK